MMYRQSLLEVSKFGGKHHCNFLVASRGLEGFVFLHTKNYRFLIYCIRTPVYEVLYQRITSQPHAIDLQIFIN